MPAIRVLFAHGLESHPNGTKVQLLRAQGFDVVAPDLEVDLGELRPDDGASFGRALARSFARSVDIVREALGRERPDVLVGSSYGGAVAAGVIALGDWQGPTILLAPAFASLQRRTESDEAAETIARFRERAANMRIVVFHDPDDETIPCADSEALARGTAIDLRVTRAGGHRLLGLVEGGELGRAIRELA